jgi:hypothetical protein
MVFTKSANEPDSISQLAAIIRSHHRGHLRDLNIELTPEGIILHGKASSFYGKQMAQEEILRQGAWTILENRIVVTNWRTSEVGAG